jgi:hypothetical protein
MKALWQRMRQAWRLSGRELDENAVANAQAAHEQAEREKAQPTAPLPPGRSNTDWTYVPPP